MLSTVYSTFNYIFLVVNQMMVFYLQYLHLLGGQAIPSYFIV